MLSGRKKQDYTEEAAAEPAVTHAVAV